MKGGIMHSSVQRNVFYHKEGGVQKEDEERKDQFRAETLSRDHCGEKRAGERDRKW